jgi:hypothetical protein
MCRTYSEWWAAGSAEALWSRAVEAAGLGDRMGCLSSGGGGAAAHAEWDRTRDIRGRREDCCCRPARLLPQ